MNKIISYLSLLVAIIVVVLVFANARSYEELTIAMILYAPLAFCAIKIFTRKRWSESRTVQPLPVPTYINEETHVVSLPDSKDNSDVADSEKRDFLKLIGAVGISYFFFSFLRGKTGSLFFGRNAESGPTILEDTTGKKINPAEKQPTDGYKISEIDNDIITYYGFTNQDGGWLIMREDTDTNSFRYAKGESGFPEVWSNRMTISYDYFHNVF
jgi:hypothetical protein